MIGRYRGQVVRVVSALSAPYIMMFGVYVIAHGHYGPGGGFAGGVLPAVAVILLRLTGDAEVIYRRFPRWIGEVSAAVGMGLFLLIGLVPLAAGGAFLEYAAIPVNAAADQLRYLGILAVEIAVGLTVFGTLVLIFDTLVDEEAA